MKTKHTELVGETYWQHFQFAFGAGVRLIHMGLIMMTHALLPEWRRYDDRIMPFVKDLRKQLMVREMTAAHHRLLKEVDRLKGDEEPPTNGSHSL